MHGNLHSVGGFIGNFVDKAPDKVPDKDADGRHKQEPKMKQNILFAWMIASGALALGAQPTDLLGDADFRPSPEHPVGWLGDRTADTGDTGDCGRAADEVGAVSGATMATRRSNRRSRTPASRSSTVPSAVRALQVSPAR